MKHKLSFRLCKLALSTTVTAMFATSGTVARADTTSGLTELVEDLQAVHTGLVNSGQLFVVKTAVGASNAASIQTWASMIHYGPAQDNTTLAAVFQDMVRLLGNGAVVANTDTEVQVQVDASRLLTDLDKVDPSITESDLQVLYENFKSSLEEQMFQQVGNETGPVVFDHAIEYAFQNTPKFSSALTNNGLPISELPGIEAFASMQFDKLPTSALDAFLSAFASSKLVPLDNSTIMQGETRYFQLQVAPDPSLGTLSGAVVPTSLVLWQTSDPYGASIGISSPTTFQVITGIPGTTTITALVDQVPVQEFKLTVTPSPNSVPVPPIGLSPSMVTETGWTESWQGVSNATSYNVYVNGAKVGSTTGTTFAITNESPGNDYEVTVTAVNKAGESHASGADVLETVRLAPHLTHFDVGPTGWTERWAAPSGSGPFKVFEDGRHVGTTLVPSYTFSNEKPNTTHSVTVVAVNPYGWDSAPSGSDSVTTLDVWKGIELNGKRLVSVQPVTITSVNYWPISSVNGALTKLGFQYRWDGTHWWLTAPKSTKVNLPKIKTGYGTVSIYLNGKLAQNVTAITKKDSTGKTSVYLPVRSVMQVLNWAGVRSTWNNGVCNIER